MLFNSYEFVLAFLPLSIMGYYFFNYCGKYRLSKIYLLFMSLYFYSYFNRIYLLIILISIIFNFLVSCLLAHFQPEGKMLRIRKMILAIAILCNLSSIFYFKYYDFFVSNTNILFHTNFNLHYLILPLGISFFTFQQISFLVDCEKENFNCDFWDYALFVSFFPQLIAGPIVTHKEILPQFADNKNKSLNYQNLAKGFMAFSIGLAKKVLIADFCGNIANIGFAEPSELNTINSLLVVFSYTMQIYFDFSGYCDMATGIGYMFNIVMPQNFNSPYKAITIGGFWKRWHITLTRFLTAYIYIPLGGNRKGIRRTCINIFIVYLVSGIWHGANWTFILWGMMHGMACVFERLEEKRVKKIHPALLWLITFSFINLTWVYFRADSISIANELIKNIFAFDFGPINANILALYNTPFIQFLNETLKLPATNAFNSLNVAMIFNISLLFIVLGTQNTNERIKDFRPNILNGVYCVMLFLVSVLSFSNVSTFLYFNF